VHEKAIDELKPGVAEDCKRQRRREHSLRDAERDHDAVGDIEVDLAGRPRTLRAQLRQSRMYSSRMCAA
jgi:hypothetical protein